MKSAYPFRYIRAWARYTGLEPDELNRLLAKAEIMGAPGDAYMLSPEGRWLTMASLERSAQRGSTPSAYTLDKIRDYAGDPPGRPDDSPDELRAARSH